MNHRPTGPTLAYRLQCTLSAEASLTQCRPTGLHTPQFLQIDSCSCFNVVDPVGAVCEGESIVRVGKSSIDTGIAAYYNNSIRLLAAVSLPCNWHAADMQ